MEYRRSWNDMEVSGVEGHGIPWKEREGHGRSWKEVEWKAIEGHGRKWSHETGMTANTPEKMQSASRARGEDYR